MNDKKYEITESYIVIEGQEIKTYGIKCNISEVKPINDVSTDKSKVQKIVDLLNKYDLDPIQLQEVCEDEIIE